MTRGATIVDLRNSIAAIVGQLTVQSGTGEISNEAIMQAVKGQFPSLIASLNNELIDCMLIKLINDVCGRRRGTAHGINGPDLFGEYPDVPRGVTIMKGIKKDPRSLSFVEAEHWVQAHDAKPVNKTASALRKVLEDCRPYRISDDQTLENALGMKRDAEQSK